MNTFLKSVCRFQRAPVATGIADPTHYEVQTLNNTYRGLIVTQDNMVMQLRTHDGKPVKILKENIKKISIVESN